jgi:hypothetical protein
MYTVPRGGTGVVYLLWFYLNDLNCLLTGSLCVYILCVIVYIYIYKGCSSETYTRAQKHIQYVFDNNHYTTVTTHGWQYETGYRY